MTLEELGALIENATPEQVKAVLDFTPPVDKTGEVCDRLSALTARVDALESAPHESDEIDTSANVADYFKNLD